MGSSSCDGKHYLNIVATGQKSVRFYAADPRTCRGMLLRARAFALPSAADLTVVATKRSPKVVMLDNGPIGGQILPEGIGLPHNIIFIRHAAETPADIAFQIDARRLTKHHTFPIVRSPTKPRARP